VFDGYLTAADIQELANAAISGDVFEFDRQLWFANVRRGFVATLKISAQPLQQFKLDLAKLNTVERLEDGSVPLEQFLANIAGLLRTAGRVEAAIFDRHASGAGNHAQGVHALPVVANLPEIVRNEAIVHQDDTVAFGFLAAALAAGRSIGRITVPRFEIGRQRVLPNGGPWIMNGTGWLIGKDIFITNHHVINARDAREAPASTADMEKQAAGATIGFDFDAEGSLTETIAVSKLELAEPGLDYAILRLSNAPARRQPLSINLQAVTMTPSTYLPVNIIQHPRGKPKRIAFRNNLLSGSDADSIRYFTDTDFGSSGAPVCDDTWRVVALHRGAEQVRGVKFQGKDTAFVNFGTQIARLLSDLQQRLATVHSEILATQGAVGVGT
jgi:hypothetical protein